MGVNTNGSLRFKDFLQAVVIAGCIAGTAFLIVHISLNAIINGRNPWFTLRMIAAIILGTSALPPPATFNLGIVLVAALLHYGLSILYTSVGATVARPQLMPAITMGAVLGMLLYMINFYIFTGLFPWFEGARNWISIVTHIVFGSVASVLFLHLQRRAADKVKRKKYIWLL